MSGSPLLMFEHGGLAELGRVPELAVAEFRAHVLDAVSGGARIATFFGRPAPGGAVRLLIVLSEEYTGILSAAATTVYDSYTALTPECPQAHWFEREIAEQWGVVPRGHPWLKPIRFHPSYRDGKDAWHRAEAPAAGDADFFRMEGEEIHEVAVGPVHAGIIEPGHFRFQCHGERVFHLEIALGYQHRGIERRLRGGPNARTLPYMETLAGDTSIGHALACCEALEALAGTRVPTRAHVLRGAALELERLANHVGDLGALAADIGFLPTASYCGRIRGDLLNMTAVLCGNRFGRGLVRPGGTAFDLAEEHVRDLQRRLRAAEQDTTGAAELLWQSSSVMGRFEDTGAITAETAQALGLVGPAARACGIERDVRRDFPSGIFRYAQIPVATFGSGDVFARAFVRALEIQRSIAFLKAQLDTLSPGPVLAPFGACAPNALAVALVEGWRGEICHTCLTGEDGRIDHYKVVDPSFHNWMGLAMALRGQQISDFPLCNKSFNLSYCGHDL
ncbi:MAG TPA: NADH-quinone oxidoreductase subunit C [Planctomycetota bacterium]|nr:MAG: Hydrogenase-4 component G [Planctomycetes bacterium ADurb.Bin069]HNR99287.1 NADH-quinone oxidoreductase subunit C [Planctomycetota bacterium]HNU26098.1 NADH-quinone oxidoreductase subunit C [Planctomycetota bacterium]HOE30873.1 NADH-quinone oxidoreductase subunit C [Planctomycetota bacterium]HOE87959.1 NADH-quinone oxidoreductase subunit C [Planctomycetota bacterium]